MSRRDFTDEEVALIRKCVADGLTAKKASYHFEDRSPKILRAKVVSMGLEFAKRTPRPVVAPPRPAPLPTVQPRSTENFTAYFCGDPAPGRSALDQRNTR